MDDDAYAIVLTAVRLYRDLDGDGARLPGYVDAYLRSNPPMPVAPDVRHFVARVFTHAVGRLAMQPETA